MTRNAIVIGIVLAVALFGPTELAVGNATSLQQTAERPTVVEVELPDLSRMHEAVQAQLREAYEALQAVESGLDPERATDPHAARSQAYGELGKLLLAGDYLDAAERCFVNARRLAPGEFRWPYYLAHVVMRKGDLDQAVEYLDEALQLRPGDLATLVWLAHAHIDLGQPEAAAPVLEAARSRYPDAPAVWYQEGRAALAAEDHTRAVELFENALSQNPGATVIYYPLALAYRGLGDLERAQDYLSRRGDASGAVTLPDPLMAEVYTALRSPQAYRDLGLQASEQGDWPEAVRQFRGAVDLAPSNSAMRLNLGAALIQSGDARAALTELEAAVGLDPELAAAHYLMGTLLERGGRDQAAIDRYTLAVTHDENLSVAYLLLADALRRTGQFEASLPYYQRVIEREEARFGEVMALVRLGRYQAAHERLRNAIEQYPNQPAFPHALARLLAASPDDQIRNGQRALELVQTLAQDHKTAAVAETMAMAFAELGQFAEAVEWQRFAMAVATDAARADIARAMSLNLARYQQGQPCRTPWRDDEPEHNPGPVVEPGLLGLPPVL